MWCDLLDESNPSRFARKSRCAKHSNWSNVLSWDGQRWNAFFYQFIDRFVQWRSIWLAILTLDSTLQETAEDIGQPSGRCAMLRCPLMLRLVWTGGAENLGITDGTCKALVDRCHQMSSSWSPARQGLTFSCAGTDTRSHSKLWHVSHFYRWQRHCSCTIHLYYCGHGALEASSAFQGCTHFRDQKQDARIQSVIKLDHIVTTSHLRMLTPWPLLFCFHPAVAYFIGLFRCQASTAAAGETFCLFHTLPWRFAFETSANIFPVCRCNAMQTDWQQSPDPAKLVFAWSTIWTRGMVSSEAAAAYSNTSMIETLQPLHSPETLPEGFRDLAFWTSQGLGLTLHFACCATPAFRYLVLHAWHLGWVFLTKRNQTAMLCLGQLIS